MQLGTYCGIRPLGKSVQGLRPFFKEKQVVLIGLLAS